jgi:hypothetical protein
MNGQFSHIEKLLDLLSKRNRLKLGLYIPEIKKAR